MYQQPLINARLSTYLTMRPLLVRQFHILATRRVYQASSTNPRNPNRKSSSSNMAPKFSAGMDEARLTTQIDALLKAGWALDKEETGLVKTYYFHLYSRCLDLVQIVGIRCKSTKHHPEMTIRNGSVTIHWHTHHPSGLSDKDLLMAQFCDEEAAVLKPVGKEEATKCEPPPTT